MRCLFVELPAVVRIALVQVAAHEDGRRLSCLDQSLTTWHTMALTTTTPVSVESGLWLARSHPR